jgi:signal transduction histidine kinase
MRFRTWPVAAVGLAALLILVAASVLTATRRAQEIYASLDQLNAHHRELDAKLRLLRSDVNLSGIFVRDYLLDTERERAPEYRERLAEYRSSNAATIDELRTLLADPDARDRLDHLRETLDDYWGTFEPLFDWTPVEKQTRSLGFLRRDVLPRREAVLAIAQQIQELNNRNLDMQRQEVERRYAGFTTDLHTLLWRTLLLGIVVALTVVVRLRIMERRSEEHRADAEEAEQTMRALSQQIVATQEEERRKLSRELHDHVGQLLTALRMEVGRVDRLRATPAAGTAVAECRQLIDNLVRVVRDLSLGLRPSMLDDLGLEPALEWLVREVQRRSQLSVDLRIDGSVAGLADHERTCIYRVVQESLTNCVRHAQANRVRIRIERDDPAVRVEIVDDGVGIDPRARRNGLGLRGMEERVKELGGSFAVTRGDAGGTIVRFSLPIQAPAMPQETGLASLAG